MAHDMSIDTGPQQQEAALPQTVVVRSSSRQMPGNLRCHA